MVVSALVEISLAVVTALTVVRAGLVLSVDRCAEVMLGVVSTIEVASDVVSTLVEETVSVVETALVSAGVVASVVSRALGVVSLMDVLSGVVTPVVITSEVDTPTVLSTGVLLLVDNRSLVAGVVSTDVVTSATVVSAFVLAALSVDATTLLIVLLVVCIVACEVVLDVAVAGGVVCCVVNLSVAKVVRASDVLSEVTLEVDFSVTSVVVST